MRGARWQKQKSMPGAEFHAGILSSHNYLGVQMKNVKNNTKGVSEKYSSTAWLPGNTFRLEWLCAVTVRLRFCPV
jgi:hypothetical protein